MHQASLNWDILTKHAAGEATTEENRLVQQWLQASAENRKLYRQVSSLLETPVGADDALVFTPDTDKAWAKMQQRLNLSQQKEATGAAKPAAKVVPLYKWVMRVAAALVVGLTFAWLIMSNHEQALVPEQAFTQQTSTTNQQTEFTLPDGTKVWLNRNSVLRYPESFAANKREVYLEGEAFFDVTKNPEQPFLIHAQQSVTKVLGTSFNVNAYPQQQEVKVTVVTGKVALADHTKPDEPVLLTPGELGQFDKKSGAVYERENPDLNFMAWRTGVLTFRNEKLREVVNALAQHYQVRIEMDEEKLADCRVTVTLDNQPLQEVLEVIKLTLDLEYEEDHGKYILSGPGCSVSL